MMNRKPSLKAVRPIEFDLQNSEQSQNWQQTATSSAANYQTEPKKSNTALIIATTVLATLLIFGNRRCRVVLFRK